VHLLLQPGQTVATTTLTILNDTLPEDNEIIYVYIVSLTSGVTVARPSTHNGRKVGFSLQASDFTSFYIFLVYITRNNFDILHVRLI